MKASAAPGGKGPARSPLCSPCHSGRSTRHPHRGGWCGLSRDHIASKAGPGVTPRTRNQLSSKAVLPNGRLERSGGVWSWCGRLHPVSGSMPKGAQCPPSVRAAEGSPVHSTRVLALGDEQRDLGATRLPQPANRTPGGLLLRSPRSRATALPRTCHQARNEPWRGLSHPHPLRLDSTGPRSQSTWQEVPLAPERPRCGGFHEFDTRCPITVAATHVSVSQTVAVSADMGVFTPTRAR